MAHNLVPDGYDAVLREMHAPLGVATYRFTQALSQALEGNLPRIEELEATLREVGEASEEPEEEE